LLGFVAAVNVKKFEI